MPTPTPLSNNEEFAHLNRQLQLFLTPYQTLTYHSIKELLLCRQQRAYLFPVMKTRYNEETFTSLRMIQDEPSKTPIIELYTSEGNVYTLEELGINQLLDLSYHLERSYNQPIHLHISNTPTENCTTPFAFLNTTIHFNHIQEAFMFLTAQLVAIEGADKQYPYLLAAWRGINLTLYYGKSTEDFQTASFTFEPACGFHHPSLAVVNRRSQNNEPKGKDGPNHFDAMLAVNCTPLHPN